MISIASRLRSSHAAIHDALAQFACDMRVACPGIIQSFDATKQTATVRLALREVVRMNGEQKALEIPDLPDVPVVLPRAGGFALTLPVKPGEECLVIFADMCIDSWWQSGGLQNQIERRRHDLSDGFAILGPWSQPRKLANYSASTAQVRTEDGQSYIELTADHKANIVAPGGVSITGNVTVTGTVTSSGEVTANGHTVTQHVHPGVQSGSSSTQKPTG